MNNAGFEPAHIWVITPNTEGCEWVPMDVLEKAVSPCRGVIWVIYISLLHNWGAIWIAPKS